MRKLLIVALLSGVIVFLSMTPKQRPANFENSARFARQIYLKHLSSLDSFLAEYPKFFYDSSYNVREQKYRELCYYFKRTTSFMVYYNPDYYYKKLIGPFQFSPNDRKSFFGLVPDSWLLLGPIGNEPDSVLRQMSAADIETQREALVDFVKKYREALKGCGVRQSVSSMDASTLFDALRTEIFRITTVDLSNADIVIESGALMSLRASIESWLQYTGELSKELKGSAKIYQTGWKNLSTGLLDYFSNHQDFKTFDRMLVTRQYLIPLSTWLYNVQVASNIPFIQKFAAIRTGMKHIYDNNIYNADYFAPNENAWYTPEKAKLGELLFFDPVLSDNNKRACASCHKPEMAFTDGKTKAVGFDFDDLPRNSPTVINSGFQQDNFWDMRANSLEDQLDSVINNSHELHSSFENVIARLNASPEYVSLFNAAFPDTKRNGISRADVKNAIGVYERTLTGMNSRFDQYMRGDDSKMNAAEINGFNVYMGKAKCSNCHYAPLFNGALPPYYDITDHHSLGVPVKDSMIVYEIDSDKGVFKSTQNPFFSFSFKTPTVRNVELTAPYMHNGIFKTLEQVVDFYDHAAGEKFRKDMKKGMAPLPFFTVFPEELKLTAEEKKDLVAFLKTLTDTSSAKKPSRLPEIKGSYSNINKRVIGGEY